MISLISFKKQTQFKRVLSLFIAVTFIFSLIIPPQARAQMMVPQTVLNLPPVGTMVTPSDAFNPVMIKGVTLNPADPFKFDFIVNKGDTNLNETELRNESTKLIKYFLASITVPEKEMWVNLSPYEKDRMVPEGLGQTELGRDMLAQDYLLKQLTSSLVYPEKQLGQKFWEKVYAKAQELYGTTDIPLNTFNKVWIVPENATVYVNENNAFVLNSHLKVMLEEDYVALQKSMGNKDFGVSELGSDNAKIVSGISSDVVREVVIPAIEKEVNTGKTFANLRQIFNSMILATWYKQNLKDALLNRVYSNQNKTAGVDVADKDIKNKIYNQYLEAFKKGVYNYIREDYDPASQEIVHRKYFSGGLMTPGHVKVKNFAMMTAEDFAMAGDLEGKNVLIQSIAVESTENNAKVIANATDSAMASKNDVFNAIVRPEMSSREIFQELIDERKLLGPALDLSDPNDNARVARIWPQFRKMIKALEKDGKIINRNGLISKKTDAAMLVSTPEQKEALKKGMNKAILILKLDAEQAKRLFSYSSVSYFIKVVDLDHPRFLEEKFISDFVHFCRFEINKKIFNKYGISNFQSLYSTLERDELPYFIDKITGFNLMLEYALRRGDISKSSLKFIIKAIAGVEDFSVKQKVMDRLDPVLDGTINVRSFQDSVKLRKDIKNFIRKETKDEAMVGVIQEGLFKGTREATQALNDRDLKGVKVLLRTNQNVPINDQGEIEDLTRLKEALPIIKFLLDKDADVILIGHSGRFEEGSDSRKSLKPTADFFQQEFPDNSVIFYPKSIDENGLEITDKDLVSDPSKKLPGRLHILDNLRFAVNGETGKKTDATRQEFSEGLSNLADILIVDSYGDFGSKGASIEDLPIAFAKKGKEFFVGPSMVKESKKLDAVVKNGVHAVIAGGAKKDKINPIKDIAKGNLSKGGFILLGSAPSLEYEKGNDVIKELVDTMPDKVFVTQDYNKPGETFDIGERTIKSFKDKLLSLKSGQNVIVNGVFGWVEGGYTTGTDEIFDKTLKELANKGVNVIFVGGDSCANARKYGLDKLEHVTLITGGGVPLKIIAGKTLTGVVAFREALKVEKQKSQKFDAAMGAVDAAMVNDFKVARAEDIIGKEKPEDEYWVGMMTGGGLAPGHNTLIYWFLKTSLEKGIQGKKVRVILFPNGWAGASDIEKAKQARFLDLDTMQPFERTGGSVAKTSRTNIHKDSKKGLAEKTMENLARIQLDAFIGLGGDDTSGAEAKLIQKFKEYNPNLTFLAGPKTMDNDIRLGVVEDWMFTERGFAEEGVASLITMLIHDGYLNADGSVVNEYKGFSDEYKQSLPGYGYSNEEAELIERILWEVQFNKFAQTYGADSYAEEGTRIAMSHKIDARTKKQIVIIGVFGRDSGYVAADIGARIHADVTIIPEAGDVNVKEEIGYIREAWEKRGYAVVVISEGAKIVRNSKFKKDGNYSIFENAFRQSPVAQEIYEKDEAAARKKASDKGEDDFGHPKLSGTERLFGALVKAEIPEADVSVPGKLDYHPRESNVSEKDYKRTKAIGIGMHDFLEKGKDGFLVIYNHIKDTVYGKKLQPEMGGRVFDYKGQWIEKEGEMYRMANRARFPLINEKIEILSLEERVVNLLNKNNIQTIAELISNTATELEAMDGIDRKDVLKIIRALYDLDYELDRSDVKSVFEKDENVHRIGIVTAGEDAVAANAIINSVIKNSPTVTQDGKTIEFVGIPMGYMGLTSDDLLEKSRVLRADETELYAEMGGSILGTSVHNPFKEVQFGNRPQSMLESIEALGLDSMIVMDNRTDTSDKLQKLLDQNKMDVSIYLIPISVEDDMDLPEDGKTLGTASYIQEASRFAKYLKTSARDQDRIFVEQISGRHSGRLALEVAKNVGATITIIPEKEKIDLKDVIKKVREAYKKHSNVLLLVADNTVLDANGKDQEYIYAALKDPIVAKAYEESMKNPEKDDFGKVFIKDTTGMVAQAILKVALEDDPDFKGVKVTRPGRIEHGTVAGFVAKEDLEMAEKMGETLANRISSGKDGGSVLYVNGEDEVKILPLSEKIGIRSLDIKGKDKELFMQSNVIYYPQYDKEQAPFELFQKVIDAAMASIETKEIGETRKAKFGTSGDRGTQGRDFNMDLVHRLAQGSAEYYKEMEPGKYVYVVYDTRGGNKEYALETAAILAGNGVPVKIIAEAATPTPVVTYLASIAKDVGGVINLTASHSPYMDRGFKVSPDHGGAAPKEMTDAVTEKANATNVYNFMDYKKAKEAKLIQEVSKEEVVHAYVYDYIIPTLKKIGAWEDIVNYFKVNDDMKLIVDAMQGTAVDYLDELYKAIGKAAGRQDYYEMIHTNNKDPKFSEVDGSPRPDAAKHNKGLREEVAKYKKALGIAVDGDADRFGFVDVGGKFIPANDMIGLIAYFLKKEIGLEGALGATIATSGMVKAVADFLGEDFIEVAVGFKWFVDIETKHKAEMEAKGLEYKPKFLVAGEESAHVAIGPFMRTFDDGIAVGLMGLWMVARTGKSISEYKDEVEKAIGKKFHMELQTIQNAERTDEIKVGMTALANRTKKEMEAGTPIEDTYIVKALAKNEKLAKLWKKTGEKVVGIKTIDGVKLILKSGAWVVMRNSGTEPIVKLYVEVTYPYDGELDVEAKDTLFVAVNEVVKGYDLLRPDHIQYIITNGLSKSDIFSPKTDKVKVVKQIDARSQDLNLKRRVIVSRKLSNAERFEPVSRDILQPLTSEIEEIVKNEIPGQTLKFERAFKNGELLLAEGYLQPAKVDAAQTVSLPDDWMKNSSKIGTTAFVSSLDEAKQQKVLESLETFAATPSANKKVFKGATGMEDAERASESLVKNFSFDQAKKTVADENTIVVFDANNNSKIIIFEYQDAPKAQSNYQAIVVFYPSLGRSQHYLVEPVTKTSLDHYRNLASIGEEKGPDSAMQTTQEKEWHQGGINLDPSLLDLQIKRDANWVPLPADQQDFENINVQGFIPVIIDITPAVNLPMLLGFDLDAHKDQRQANGSRSGLPMQLGELKARFELENIS